MRAMNQTRFATRRRLTVCLFGWLLFIAQAACAAQPADLVLRGGTVVTMTDEQPMAEAVAVRGDRVVAVGSAADIGKLIGEKTVVIDLDGKMLTPGFIEGHGHFLSLGQSKQILDFTAARSWDDVVEQVVAAAKQAPAGQWIVGRGWHQGRWEKKPDPHVEGYPTHDELSRLTPKHPVMLTHRAGHMLFANQRAMRLAGVGKSTADPAGGELLRRADGALTGVFRENAMSLVRSGYSRSIRQRTATRVSTDLEEIVRLAGEECWRHGVTSFQDAGASFADVDFFRKLADRGELPVRLWVMLDEGNDALARNIGRYRLIDHAHHFLTVRAIKRMSDGALGTHGAWLLQPYDDLPNSTGHNTTSLAYLRRTASLAAANDLQLCVHAIGDRANREVLTLFSEALPREQLARRRWRIEHAQHIDQGDIPRFREFGVIASMQGVHCTSDAPFVIARLGQRRAKYGAYAWRSLLDAKVVVINGSDTPVERISPLASFYSSVTRKLPNGVAFFPEQAMTRREALRSYTRDAAFAAFEERDKGVLAPGKLADMVVLSNNILTAEEEQLRKTRVVYTIVGGKVKYQRKPAEE